MSQNWGRFRSHRPSTRAQVEEGSGDGSDGEGDGDSGGGCGCGCTGLVIGIAIGAVAVTWAGPPELLSEFVDYIRSLLQ